MFKILNAIKDTYITDKLIAGSRATHANVGRAATLDLYKLYGENEINNQSVIELSRLLIKFDLTQLRTLYQQNKLDITDPTFNVTLKLFDVYGGQPTPDNFDIVVHPLSKSFDEGRGKDIVKYADLDVCNFLTAAYPNDTWIMSGANDGGAVSGSHDYFTTLNTVNDLQSTQHFTTGEEDLEIDVTKIVSATLANIIPDSGFRIAFSNTIENDTRTYFVKRFVGRNAYNDEKHPRLIVRFDDSLLDDSRSPELDVDCNIFLYNYRLNNLTNATNTSGTQLTGSNCILLKLSTPISGGYYELYFTGSQYTIGDNGVTGIYFAQAYVSSSNNNVKTKLLQTGSVDFVPIWSTVDSTTTFVTGSSITFVTPTRLDHKLDHNDYTISTSGIRSTHSTNESFVVRVNLFDHKSPLIKLVKRPIELRGLVVRYVYYQIRDAITQDIVVPFDTTYHSTRISSDNDGMWFVLDTNNLKNKHSYVIDIMIATSDSNSTYYNVSNVFRIDNQVR